MILVIWATKYLPLSVFPAADSISRCHLCSLKWVPAPENCKNQEINRIKLKKILTVKLCTLTTTIS